MRLGGEMHQRVDVVPHQQVVHESVVADVAADEMHELAIDDVLDAGEVAGIGERIEHHQRGRGMLAA